MTDRPDYAWWSAAIAGEKPATYETAECGYFKMRDRRGVNKELAAIKRPWIACAIFRDLNTGELVAERAGEACPIEHLWPWCARFPIPYDEYEFWHKNGHFPEVEPA
jgi:hypothetical protein